MFWWIVNSIISSFGTITWKKSIELSRMGNWAFLLLGFPAAAILAGGYLLAGQVRFDLPAQTYAMMFLLSFLWIVSISINQHIFREEKVSALIPFENLASVLTIVIAYFLFGKTSSVTLAVAIVTIAIIFASSFDFRNFILPKNVSLVFGWKLLIAFRTLLLAYALPEVWSVGYFFFTTVFSNLIILVPLIRKDEWKTISQWSRSFYSYRMAAAFTGQVSLFIGYFLLEKLGLVQSTLLWFLTIVSTIALSYLILHDAPKKRNVYLALLVSCLVFIGTYYS